MYIINPLTNLFICQIIYLFIYKYVDIPLPTNVQEQLTGTLFCIWQQHIMSECVL